MRVIVCKECNKEKPYHCKGLCETCYDRLWTRRKRAKFKKLPIQSQCPVCNTNFPKIPYNKKFCSPKCANRFFNKKYPDKYKKYRERHAEKIKISNRQYNLINHQKRLEIYKKYRDKKRGYSIDFEKIINYCDRCGKEFKPKSRLHPHQKYCSKGCRVLQTSKRFRKNNPEAYKSALKRYYNSEKGKLNVYKKIKNREVYL